MAAVAATKLQGALLLVGYTLGLGIPFLVIALFFDRAPALMRPLVRHGRMVSLIGGLLVAAIGLRDDLRPARAAAALLQLQHGCLT